MIKIGILGGGQLARMLLQEGANYPVETFVMENDDHCPAAHLCHHFQVGDIRNMEDVIHFGKNLDVITIDIESVSVEGLEELKKMGKRIVPEPDVLKTIKNKVLQKQFYENNHIPSPEFKITQSREDLKQYGAFLPAVHKIGEGGYDGKGVQVIRSADDLKKGFEGPSVLEKMVDIKMEVAVMVAVGSDGNQIVYPAVEMVFDPNLNLLDYQICPADLDEKTLEDAAFIAMKVARHFNSPGLYAVEMFVDQSNKVWVNETAPRVHNSGHHTIEAHQTSQYDNLWRILMDMPLGSGKMILPSALVNLLGMEGSEGPACYHGLDELLKMDQTYLHAYGKEVSKPGRKMGHITILGKDQAELTSKVKKIKEIVSISGKP